MWGLVCGSYFITVNPSPPRILCSGQVILLELWDILTHLNACSFKGPRFERKKSCFMVHLRWAQVLFHSQCPMAWKPQFRNTRFNKHTQRWLQAQNLACLCFLLICFPSQKNSLASHQFICALKKQAFGHTFSGDIWMFLKGGSV
jgi:hypothetical protein